MSVCQPLLLSSLFSSSVIIKAIYGVFILLWGGLGGLPPRRRTVSVSLCRTGLKFDKSTKRGRRHNWYFVPEYLSTYLPEMNIGEQRIIGIRYLFTCRPVNLSTCLPGLTGENIG